MRGDTREPQEILSQEDVQSPRNTAVFLLPVVKTGNGKVRTQGPRRTACPEGPRHLQRKPPRVRLPEDAGGTPRQGCRGKGVETASHHARERALSCHTQEVETLPQGQMRRHVQREPGAA